MKIHCLGTTGYHPSNTRQTACYVLASDGIVLDAGTGIHRLAPLIETQSLDILISHAHLDHTIGLTFLLDVFFQRPVDTVRVWGQQIKLDAIRTHLFNEHLFPVPLKVTWHAIDQLNTFKIGDDSQADDASRVIVDWRPQDHPGGSVGYRLRWPGQQKSLIYATDTTGDASEEMRRWIDGCDLLMHECYFRDHEREWALKTGHCWTSRAAEIAKHGSVKKLLLTHINPLADGDDPVDISKARNIFPETYIATDCEVVHF